MNLAVITDEISRDFITATEVLSRLGITNLELRSLRTGRVPYIAEEEEQELHKYIARNRCRIHAMSPAVAKLNIETPDLRKKTLKHLEDSIEFAKRFNISNIIMFSFRKKNKYDLEEEMPQLGWDILEEVLDIGEQNQVQILLENHSSCYISTMDSIVYALERPGLQGRLKLNWDPNNSCQVDKREYGQGLDQIFHSIESIHVKDTVFCNGSEEVRLPLGEGAVGWDNIFRDLQRLNYQKTFSVETHYEPFIHNTLKDIENLRIYLDKYFEKEN